MTDVNATKSGGVGRKAGNAQLSQGSCFSLLDLDLNLGNGVSNVRGWSASAAVRMACRYGHVSD